MKLILMHSKRYWIMLKAYLVSVLIWWLILSATARMAAPYMINNGWIAGTGRGKGVSPWAPAAVPIFRLLVVIGLFYCASVKKE